MPTKKRKYEARFPPARIKKIMQTDEDIGKVAAAVPVIISRALEIFLQSLVEKTSQHTQGRRAKTMTTAHLKHCIESENQFDFLKDLVLNVADVSNQEEEDSKECSEQKPKRQRRPRVNTERKKKAKREEKSSSEESNDEDSSTERDKESSPISNTSTKSKNTETNSISASTKPEGMHPLSNPSSEISTTSHFPMPRPTVPTMFTSNMDDDDDYDS